MNNSSLVQQLSLSTFTPSAMSQEVLEGIFVQREELLQMVVKDLAESLRGARQYLMLVGARGMGKTHFVSLVYHRLKGLPEFQEQAASASLLIAWLREEEYGVNSWLYLVVEILRALELEGVDIKGAIEKLMGVSIREAEYLANHLLLEAIGDRTLLIITENFDKLLAGLGDAEQFKFRSFLQENNCCSILATTPKISQDTSSRSKPFFGFFSRIDLPAFGHEDAIAMLVKIADISGNTKLVNFLQTSEGISRVRALHHLAGGNPRVYALFAQLVTEESLEALLPAVTEMLDKLTPYYQSKIESLGQSDDQQKIVMFLARETRAVTVKEIAAQCFISSERTTSTALKKLKDKGFVIAVQKGREVFYELSEVLMRLCLEMKSTRNGNLKFCVDLIRIWFSPQQQQENLEQLEAAGRLEHAAYFRQARSDSRPHPVLVACIKDLQLSLDDGAGLTALQVWHELADFNQVSEVDRQRIASLIKTGEYSQALIDISGILENCVATAASLYLEGLIFYEQGNYLAALEKFKQCLDRDSKYVQAWFQQGNSLDNLGRYEEAIKSYDQAISFEHDDHKAWNNRGNALVDLGCYEEAIESYDRAISFEHDDHKAWNNRGNALANLGRYEEAIESFDRAISFEHDDHKAWNNRGNALVDLGRYEEAIESYDRAISFKHDYFEAWSSRGVSLGNLDRHEEAIESYDRAISFKHDYHIAWHNRGVFLGNLGRHEEAIESSDRAISFKHDYHIAWCNRGNALANLGRHEEAIESFDRAISFKHDNHIAWNNRGNALANLGRHEEAIKSYDRAISFKHDFHIAWSNRGIALANLGRYEEAIASYDRTISFKHDDHEAWYNRGVSLFNLGRYEEAIASFDRAISFKHDKHEARSARGIVLDILVEIWHNQGLAEFDRGNYTEALSSWQKAFGTIQREQLRNASTLIQEFLDEQLLSKFQQPTISVVIPNIFGIYTTAQVLPELGVALIRNLKAIQSPIISDHTAAEWLKMWQALGSDLPEMELSLRMLAAGIKYKKDPKNDRVFLSIPQEMRPILREALGLSSDSLDPGQNYLEP